MQKKGVLKRRIKLEDYKNWQEANLKNITRII